MWRKTYYDKTGGRKAGYDKKQFTTIKYIA